MSCTFINGLNPSYTEFHLVGHSVLKGYPCVLQLIWKGMWLQHGLADLQYRVNVV
jgi:hypothetical protein